MYLFTDNGRLDIGLFTCEILLLLSTKLRIKLIRARATSYTPSDNPNANSSLIVFHFLLEIFYDLQCKLEREPAQTTARKL